MKRQQATKYFVSRQHYWGVDPEDGTVVEVAAGGLDYTNPDMLTTEWPRLGEGQEYTDPREAVEAAIRVCDAWRAAGETNAKVAIGFTGGNTIPFEPKGYEELRAQAQTLYEKSPKCAHCGEMLGSETYTHELTLDRDERFCSENCMEASYADYTESDEPTEEGDSDTDE